MAETSLEATPIAQPLDEFLREVVVTLHAAVDQGIKAVEDNPPSADKVIQDCQEMIGVIMDGNVREWLSE